MKNLKSNIKRIGIYVSFIAFGYIISRCSEIPYFEISKTVDVSNVLALIITVWLAILITTVFEKKNNDHRVEKDLVIGRVGNIYDIADSLQIESISGSIHIAEASSSLKRITTALESIYRIVDKCHFNIPDDLKSRLKVILSDIRTNLTKTPSITDEQINSTDLPIEVKDSIIHFNKERISQIEVLFESLKNLLLELQIDINKK